MGRYSAKGDILLEASPDELLVLARFDPNPSGRQWTAELLAKVFADAGLPVPTLEALEAFLRRCSAAAGRVQEIAARGLEAVPPLPERAQWIRFDPPAEAAQHAKAVIQAAPPPAIYRVSRKRVKVETQVERAPLIPFMPPRRETVESWTTREVREPVMVDPVVKEYHWVPANALIGTLAPARAGTPGRTVFGKVIQPSLPGPSEFFCGEGIRREGAELRSAREGFLRQGSGWADIVPFSRHSWILSRSQDGSTVLLDYNPGSPLLPPPRAQEILKNAAELGMDLSVLLDGPGIDALIAESMKTGEALCSRILSADRDAKMEIDISADNMKAVLNLAKSRGHGRPLNLNLLSHMIRAKGISLAAPDKVKADILAFSRGPAQELSGYILAQGIPPERERSRTLGWKASFLPEHKAAPIRERIAGHASLYPGLDCQDAFPLGDHARVAFVDEGIEFYSMSKVPPARSGTDVFGHELPPLPGEGVKVKNCGGVAIAEGYGRALATGVLLVKEEKGVQLLRVLPYRDGEVEISIAQDTMKAYATLTGHIGAGKPLTAEDVRAALAAKQVKFGIDEVAIRKAVELAEKSQEPVFNIIVARGREPAGRGRMTLDWIVKPADEKAVSIRDDGRADYRDRGSITAVQEGQALASLRREGGEGLPGMDVLGRKVEPPKEGEGDKAEAGSGVKVEYPPDGSRLFRAARRGELRYEKGKISVSVVHVISGDVGMKTGDVRFPGEIRISGSIASGSRVVAGEDIQVGAGAEACLISSEGSVRLAQGIRGQKKGLIRARGTISALFAEQATLLAVDDIKIRNSLVSCRVRTNGHLVLASERGYLVGGQIQARKGVDVQNIGSQAGVQTNLSFGQDYLMADQIESEQKEIDKLKAELLDCDRIMAIAQKTGDRLGLDEARKKKVSLMKLVEKRSLRLLNFRDQFEEHFPSEIRVRGTVFPGTVLESHNRYLEISKERNRIKFTFDPSTGRILDAPLD